MRTLRTLWIFWLLLTVGGVQAQDSPKSGIMFQEFYWDTEAPAGQSWWAHIESQLPALASAGIASVWVSSPCKGGAGQFDMGYGPYDLYDLGSKNQKGTTATRFGTKDEFLRFVTAAHRLGIKVYADVVLNHAMGADFAEANPVMEKLGWDDIADDGKVPPVNRRPGELGNLRSWTGFAPKGADGQVGTGRFPRSWRDFHPNEAEPDRNPPYHAKDFGEDFSLTPSVRQSLTDWSRWFAAQTGVDGYRLDNVKGMEPDFVGQFARATPNLWMVGELFDGNAKTVSEYLRQTGDALHVFDFPLYFALRDMTFRPESFDMRALLSRRLPDRSRAVMFCGNHDVSRSDSVLVYNIGLAHAVMLAMDGTPSVYYSDFWRAGDARKRELTTLMRAHDALAVGEELVREANKTTLAIERRGHLLAVFNSGGDGKTHEITVQTDFGPNVKLTDYVGGGKPIQTDKNGRVTVKIGPYSYAYYAPPGKKPAKPTPIMTTQVWEFADDLDTGKLTPTGQTFPITLAKGETLTAILKLDGGATGTLEITNPDGKSGASGKATAQLTAAEAGIYRVHAQTSNAARGTLTLHSAEHL